MAKPEQPVRTLLAPITPLDSAIKTFVGRDKNGPIYSRLEYLLPVAQMQRNPGSVDQILTQMDAVPNIMKALIARLEYTNPDYAARLVSAIGDRAIKPEGLIATKPNPAVQVAADTLPHENSQSEQLEPASTIHDYTSALIAAALYTSAGELSDRKLSQKLALAKNIFADDPLVKLGREASGVLSDDGLDKLGKFVLATSVAIVEHMPVAEAPAAQTNNPNAAA